MMHEKLGDLADKVISACTADKVLVVARAEEYILTRYALNRIHQHVRQELVNFTVVVEKNKKIGMASTASLEERDVLSALSKAMDNTELASGESTLDLADTGVQVFDTRSQFLDFLFHDHAERAKVVQHIAGQGEKVGAQAFGAFQVNRGTVVIKNSAGTDVRMLGDSGAIKVMYIKGHGSGYQHARFDSPGNFVWESLAEKALQKCLDSQDPRPLNPGRYTVILEPLAVASMLEQLSFFSFNARTAHQGYSYIWNERGKQVFPPHITVYDWGMDDLTLNRMPADFEGYLRKPVHFIEGGMARDVVFDSRHASLMGQPNTGHALPPESVEWSPLPLNVIMLPGSTPIDKLIESTERGILITMFHYVNSYLDPLKVLATGLTRNGTFYIEEGRVRHAVANTRFLQSFVEALQNVEAVGSELLYTGEEFMSVTAPALKVNNFNFM
ncbi:TldD/PmbA family protein [Coprothermobacteraceae bacterium]|nr:TldD/PmbA family protein [Coprothermobacteraceae bacterium]